MTGESEESEAGGDWLAPLFEQLKGAVQRAAAVLAKDDPEEKADAETLARRERVVPDLKRVVATPAFVALKPSVGAAAPAAEPSAPPSVAVNRQSLTSTAWSSIFVDA